MRLLIAITVAAGLAGCVTEWPAAQVGLAADDGPPIGWQRAIKAQYGLPLVAAPPQRAMGPALLEDGSFTTPWFVCIKQRSHVSAVKFHNGAIVGEWEHQGDLGGVCVGATYSEIAS